LHIIFPQLEECQMLRKNMILLTLLLALVPALTRIHASQKPKLAVVIVVDQMRFDYLTREQTLLTGGFKRLLDNGFQFIEAYHEHACTETGVGHATIATGCYPSHHGIVGNEWWYGAKSRWVYCAEDSGDGIVGRPGAAGRSPSNLRHPVFGDWLRKSSPESKVFAITGKDRSAILMAGFGGQAYWYYPGDGTFVTSTYYERSYPAWVDSFNLKRHAANYAADTWDHLLSLDKYIGPDRVAAEYDGKRTTFPHSFAANPNDEPTKYYGEFRYTPFFDQLILRFARDLVINEQLGADSVADLLMIGCSAGDYIGHGYGPSSHEIQDHYLRLDGYLGSFFAFLDSTVGVNQYVVALTGDHGVAPLPEELAERGIDAGRINSDTLEAVIKRIGAAVATEIKCSTNVVLTAGDGVILNYTEAKTTGHSEPWLRRAVDERIKHLSFVADAFTRDDLASGSDETRPFINLYRNNYFVDRSPDIMLRYREYWIISDEPHGTSHGTPYDYDRHVPLIFYGEGIKPGLDTLRAASVDITPTLSELLGTAPPADIDGRSLLIRLKR
jgi:predicted AlkP superfamily pyrophosphatase or phosphodiesterase